MLVLVSPLLTNDVSILFFPLPLHLQTHTPPPLFLAKCSTRFILLFCLCLLDTYSFVLEHMNISKCFIHAIRTNQSSLLSCSLVLSLFFSFTVVVFAACPSLNKWGLVFYRYNSQVIAMHKL